MTDPEISKTFDRRSAIFLGAGGVLTSILILRMLQLQLFGYNSYRKKSENNAMRVHVDLPMRGRILSADGKHLAKDIPAYRAYLIPEESNDTNAVLDAVKTQLALKDTQVTRIQATITKQRKFQPALIRDNLNWNDLAGIQSMNLPGLHVESGFLRSYPLGANAAHLCGYLGAVATAPRPDQELAASSPFFLTGVAGVEKISDEALAGRAGRTVLQVDASGRIVGEDASQNIIAKPGHDVQTTIIEPVQIALSDAIIQNKAGCGVAMEIATGNILAIASAPAFDANLFRGIDSGDYMDSLLSDDLNPFMNKAVEGAYPPGSTFKIVVALAGLESGAISPTEKIHCSGDWDFGNHTYHCWEKHGHGWVDLSDAIAFSCDIYFYQMALRIGIDAIKSMAQKLGLGQKLLNEFSKENPGILPDRRWKEKNVGQKWMLGDTVISGIGQGYILANCIQLATLSARAASNRAVVPRLFPGDAPDFAPLGLAQKNMDIVLGGLARVLEPGGTASGAAINVNGQKMGGKTGTSQVRSISKAERASGVRTNEQLEWALRNHGLFTGFAPVGDPRYVVAVVCEHAGSSGPAARAAAAVMREVLKTKN